MPSPKTYIRNRGFTPLEAGRPKVTVALAYWRGRLLTGFTLIEILIVVALFTMLAGLGLFMTMDSYRGASSRSERDIVVSLLEKARSQAINNYYGTSWGVCYLMPNYVVFNSTCASGEPTPASPNVTFNPPFPTVVFSQLAGTTTATTTGIIQNGRTDTISINNEGTINW